MSAPGSGLGRAGGLAWLAVAATVLATFAPAVFTSLAFYERDILGYWYPGIAAFHRAVREGVLPVWNPYIGFGSPYLADPNLQVAYPPTWASLLVSPEAYYKLFVVLHCVLAGAGAAAYAARLGVSRGAATLAGCAFAACGPLLSAVNLFHHFAGAAWMPWVLTAFEGVLVGGPGRPWLRLGVVGALQVLAGSGDLCLMTALAVLLRVATHLGASPAPFRAEAARLGRALLAAGGLAAALAAVQWLPTLDVTFASARVAQASSTSTYWSMHPLSLLDFMIPRLVADFPMADYVRAFVFESRGPLLRSLYLGLPLLSLAALGATVRGIPARVATIAALFFLFCALGRHTFFYSLLLSVPGIGILRYPVKYALALALAVAVLAALGFERWRRPGASRVFAGLGAVQMGVALGCLAAVAWLGQASAAEPSWMAPEAVAAGGLEAPRHALLRTALVAAVSAAAFLMRSRRPTSPAWLSVALAGLVTVDLVSSGTTVNRLAPPSLLAYRAPIVDRLRDEGARIYVALWPPECWEMARGPKGWEMQWIRSLGEQQSLSPPVGARWGIYGSYDGEFTGLGPPLTGEFTAAIREREGTPEGLRLLRSAGVNYVVAARGDRDRLALASVQDLPSAYRCPLELLRVEDPLPRVSVVDGTRPEPPSGALSALLAPEFDPGRSVLLPAPAREREPSSSFRGSARVVARTTDRLLIHVESSGPGHVVIREAFAPGWRARVDGRAAPVLQADGLFRALEVPGGSHEVELLYRPPAVVAGLFLSAGGLLVALAFLGTSLRRREVAGLRTQG